MQHFVPLNSQQHIHVSIDEQSVLAAIPNVAIIPILINEIEALAHLAPIVLTKNVDNGQLMLAILAGFEQQENLYKQSAHWQLDYLPLALARQPFLADINSGEVFIDMQHPSVNSSMGQPIFSNAGEPTSYLLQKRHCLELILNNSAQTQDFVQQLQTKLLVEPFQLDLSFKQNQQQKLTGLYTIAENKLDKLQSNDVFVMHKCGYLKAIHLMQNSLENIKKLITMKQKFE